MKELTLVIGSIYWIFLSKRKGSLRVHVWKTVSNVAHVFLLEMLPPGATTGWNEVDFQQARKPGQRSIPALQIKRTFGGQFQEMNRHCFEIWSIYIRKNA